MSALGIACGVIGGWCILAALGATVPHRAKQALAAADPGEDHEPEPEPDELTLLRAQFDAIVGAEVWFGGALNNDRHLHGGAA